MKCLKPLRNRNYELRITNYELREAVLGLFSEAFVQFLVLADKKLQVSGNTKFSNYQALVECMVMTLASIRRYQVTGKLYNGSTKLVYRRHREVDEKPVVIKLLKNLDPSLWELVQFCNQYTIAKNFNLLRIVIKFIQNSIAIALCNTLNILHRNYVLDQDIKPSNILIKFAHLFTTKATGLRLAIAHQIVAEKHQGVIKVDSQPGEGTEFVIQLKI